MTKAQRADALLWAAGWWQGERARPGMAGDPKNRDSEEAWDVSDEGHRSFESACSKSASTALSEVGALGFEIEGAEVWDRETKTWRKQKKARVV
jgi:hypothetical protein